jgi:hypothetical protein
MAARVRDAVGDESAISQHCQCHAKGYPKSSPSPHLRPSTSIPCLDYCSGLPGLLHAFRVLPVQHLEDSYPGHVCSEEAPATRMEPESSRTHSNSLCVLTSYPFLLTHFASLTFQSAKHCVPQCLCIGCAFCAPRSFQMCTQLAPGFL